jgi:uncharacterized membrane protein YeaQ/YmgE (transglycosylase-associated protein family)
MAGSRLAAVTRRSDGDDRREAGGGFMHSRPASLATERILDYHRRDARSIRAFPQFRAAASNRREIAMGIESLLVFLIVGAIAGWLAGLIVKGYGFGLIGNIVVGIIGALLATWLLPQLGVHLGVGWIREIVNATIGAVIILVILSLIRR